MKILLIFSSVMIPIVMILLYHKWTKFRLVFHGIAVISALIFGNISTVAIYNIIKDDTVFMTNIHGIFLNPFFLLSGAYLGVYLLYTITLWLLQEL